MRKSALGVVVAAGLGLSATVASADTIWRTSYNHQHYASFKFYFSCNSALMGTASMDASHDVAATASPGGDIYDCDNNQRIGASDSDSMSKATDDTFTLGDGVSANGIGNAVGWGLADSSRASFGWGPGSVQYGGTYSIATTDISVSNQSCGAPCWGGCDQPNSQDHQSVDQGTAEANADESFYIQVEGGDGCYLHLELSGSSYSVTNWHDYAPHCEGTTPLPSIACIGTPAPVESSTTTTLSVEMYEFDPLEPNGVGNLLYTFLDISGTTGAPVMNEYGESYFGTDGFIPDNTDGESDDFYDLRPHNSWMTCSEWGVTGSGEQIGLQWSYDDTTCIDQQIWESLFQAYPGTKVLKIRRTTTMSGG